MIPYLATEPVIAHQVRRAAEMGLHELNRRVGLAFEAHFENELER
jgi:hypothetical protein